MNMTEAMGKTIDEAIEIGLKELNKTKEQVEIEIIDQPSKGFLGFIGTKMAKVQLTVVNQVEDEARNFLKDVLEGMTIPDVDIQIERNQDILNITLEGPNMGVVIGRRGQTLDAVQYLVSLVVNKGEDKYVKVILDTENYRQKREETLVRLANKMARKAKKIGKTVALEPMNPYERRVIHSTLQGSPFVQTYSEGEEPYRKVVISLKK
ncbi:single-stranded nucleic acid binding R3H domain protein [Alkaliphilus metalliredigens QYMF]|uniref:RNA-binding protein KhpB n=1 Tax=Alkaliphilus metalliredigens (strain QYMF) TaxID=293826 RepID=A6TXE6_ALKMQ|nr:RNA-binding cell elongation regulator Jag/EloR [Alkaliphilus metalliredigens]ABR50864.1 single-stranded nucleic acid binding R3H domain protein [Alkaliphilus metalliredigens QYMF]